MANSEIYIDVYIRHPDYPASWTQLIRIPPDKLPIELVQSLPLSKWLRYSLFAITAAKGTLSTSAEQSEPSWQYNAATFPSESHVLYYHYDPDERVSLIDPELLQRPVTTHSSWVRDSLFPGEVKERDGHRCILTGIPHPAAAHLIPHVKGDDYIRSVINDRKRGEQVAFGIDDVRNGVALNLHSHSKFNQHCLAFMPIPNFAVELSDIRNNNFLPTTTGYLAHAFGDEDDRESALSSRPYGQSYGRFIPGRDDDRWPPDVLFDAVYGTVVHHHFHAPGSLELAKASTDKFYPKGRITARQAQEHNRFNEAEAAEAKTQEHHRDRDERALIRRNPDDGAEPEGYQPDPNDPMDAITFFVPWMCVPGGYQGALERAREERRRKLEERVASWSADVVG